MEKHCENCPVCQLYRDVAEEAHRGTKKARHFLVGCLIALGIVVAAVAAGLILA